MIKAVFFDVGDTLIEFGSKSVLKNRNSILLGFMESLGYKTEAEEIERLLREIHDYLERKYVGSVEKYKFGIGLSLLFKRLGIKVDEERINALNEKLWNIFLDGMKLKPHAKEILLALKKNGYKLAIVTNFGTREGNRIIDAFGLRKYFDLIVISEDVGAEKSTTIPFKVALEKLDLKPEEVVMVGDRGDEDILGAKLLGMKAVKVPGSHGVFGETRKADYEINDLIELKEILKID